MKTYSCSKCKKIEDEFENDKEAISFGWIIKGSKCYCVTCSKLLK